MAVVAAAVGVLVLAAAAWLGLTSAAWVRPPDRHDLTGPDAGSAAGAVVPDDDQAAWDALSRGHDPT